MRRILLMASLFLAYSGLYAQSNGEIVEKVRLKSFEQLIEYIQHTEQKDSTDLDPARFTYFSKVEVYGITYFSDGLKVKGFLLQPRKKGKYPAIIYNRGGSLDFGSLTHGVASIGLGELARLAHHGYVVAASQYRGNGGSEGREEYGGADIQDVLSLIPLLENEPKADAQKLGMFGWSRGGMTTFLSMRQTNRLKAVAVGGPSTNLTQSIIDRPDLDEWWSGFIPNYNQNKAEILRARSAEAWADKLPKNVPMLILQGANDQALPAHYTLEFSLKLTEHNVPHRLIKYEKGTHSLKEYRDEVFEELFSWFDHYLNVNNPN